MPRLYCTGEGQWRASEREIKMLARERGTDWEAVEVPTNVQGLLAFLNERALPVAAIPAPAAVEAKPVKPGHCPVCNRSEKAAAQIVQSEDIDAITDFILDRATPVLLEHIFTSLGARFHELRTDLERARR